MRYVQYSTIKASHRNTILYMTKNNYKEDAIETTKEALQKSLEELRPDKYGRVDLYHTSKGVEDIANLLHDTHFGLNIVNYGDFDELPFLRIFSYLALDLTSKENRKIKGIIVLNALERYFSLITEALDLSIAYQDNIAKIRFNKSEDYIVRHQIEGNMLACHKILKKHSSTDTLSVTFTHEQPDDNLTPYINAFGVIPTFEHVENSLNVSCGAPFSKLNSEIVDLFAQLESEKKMISSSYIYSERLTELFKNALYMGINTREKFARIFNVSVRTLQRKLQNDGNSFSSILEEVRKEQSILLLKDSQLTINHVAYLLGYQDPSAFYKAFKKWYKMTPAQYKTDNL